MSRVIFLSLLQVAVILPLTSSYGAPPLAPPAKMSLRGCPDKCGDVAIPYPFGTKDGCYYGGDHHFYIDCNKTTEKPLHGNFPLLKISVDGGFLRVLTTVAADCFGADKNSSDPYTYTTNKHLGRFHFSPYRNKFTGVGCDTVAFLLDAAKNASVGCLSICSSPDSVHDGVCNGGGCCQNSDLPVGLQNLTLFLRSFNDHKDVKDFNPCSYAFLVDQEEFRFNKSYYFGKDLSNSGAVPTVIDWAVGHGTNCSGAAMNPASFACKENTECIDSVHGDGYLCNCSTGFYGNPYIGCQDINECGNPEQYPCNGTCFNTQGNWSCIPHYQAKKDHGFIIMIIAIGASVAFIALLIECCVVYSGLKKRRQRQLKKAFFERNGGLRLQDNLSQVEHAQSAFKIFTAEEMEAATNNFDKSRVVGSGGFADVYKGHLCDGTVVAIKKPKTKSLEGSEDVQFINEVILLSKIQHHNVVTFLGCCLEAEAPLLVYEFISNGTLHDHLHCRDGSRPRLSWETRLKIAAETAGVLAYLHYDHRPSIIHSDIKPHNILLGDEFTAKVSDFGISKLAPQNETELYTKVKGTLGYLDPEFIQSGQLTEKSDVYSFGVVLLELLTGQKVLSFTRQKEDWCLVNYFKSSFASGCLTDTLDSSVVGDENIKQIREVAEIAMLCVSVKSEERPSMKEVAMELGGMIMEGKSKSWVKHNNLEEREQLLNKALETYSTYSSAGCSSSGTGDYIMMVPSDGSR
ncbi:hypothetical protein V2J09_007640 [Rumex salicifolius]